MDVAADDDDLKSETGELDYETSDDDDGEKLTSTAAEKSPRRIAVKSPIDKDGGEISSGREDDNANENDSNFKNADLEDGEIDELEEGEVKDDESFMDSTTKSPRKIPFLSNYAPKLSNYDSASTENGVCRFFLRGQCTWASFCKFSHPGSDNSNEF
uniref:C3H1-type domain-containing protein n=1 Tax=Romanomermis culicivorax TaxID=13658 RepID=A0A915JBV4_ROMCU